MCIRDRRGEFVVVVAGADKAAGSVDITADALLAKLCEHMPPGKAAAVAAAVSGQTRAALYRKALKQQRRATPSST